MESIKDGIGTEGGRISRVDAGLGGVSLGEGSDAGLNRLAEWEKRERVGIGCGYR
jgi:hypothetical protein